MPLYKPIPVAVFDKLTLKNMMNKYKILVFPCGSEVALEIHRSLKYSRYIELWGGSSVDDHGKFMYKNYIPNIPFITSKKFIPYLKEIISNYNFDAIYPSMDSVITLLKGEESNLKCKVISSPQRTTELCLSKKATYKYLKGKVRTPKVYKSIDEVHGNFPVFLKPDIGYGSQGAKMVNSTDEIINHTKAYPSSIILEYLPDQEYTIDCFTDRHRNLLFAGARERKRIRTGISVNTSNVSLQNEFQEFAQILNELIEFRGGWFFQLKRNCNEKLTLLEIASRIGGSSALFRVKGINFALLSIFDSFDKDVEILENPYEVELDRSFSNKYRLNIDYGVIYVDFDDCLIIDKKINCELIKLLYNALNRKKTIKLLTRHDGNISSILNKYKLKQIFDEIIHISKDDFKSDYIHEKNAIFIDDSFQERNEVLKKCNIPVFSPDMIECLI